MYRIQRNDDRTIPDLVADEVQADTRLGSYPLYAVFDSLREYAAQIGMGEDAQIFADYRDAWGD